MRKTSDIKGSIVLLCKNDGGVIIKPSNIETYGAS